jgi:hypothetical protein
VEVTNILLEPSSDVPLEKNGLDPEKAYSVRKAYEDRGIEVMADAVTVSA